MSLVDWLLYSAIRKEALLTSQIFVLPPPEHVATLLADVERFIHDTVTDLPPMVKVSLIHAQFEFIHPFLDGNGRIGRLLIAALFEMLPVMQRFTIERVRQQLNTTSQPRQQQSMCWKRWTS